MNRHFLHQQHGPAEFYRETISNEPLWKYKCHGVNWKYNMRQLVCMMVSVWGMPRQWRPHAEVVIATVCFAPTPSEALPSNTCKTPPTWCSTLGLELLISVLILVPTILIECNKAGAECDRSWKLQIVDDTWGHMQKGKLILFQCYPKIFAVT